MSAQFELALSQQLTRLRALERALHDEGPWAFRVGDLQYDGSVKYIRGIPATRRIETSRQSVIFAAELFSHCGQEKVIDLMTVRDREIISTQTVRLPPGASLFEWELGLDAVAA
jgi:hypothetical protein